MPAAPVWVPGPDDLIRVSPAKRALDVALAVSMVLLASPVIVLIVLAELLGSLCVAADRGPVLYAEVRVSQGKLFTLLKFRILRMEAIRRIRDDGAVPKDVENTPGTLTATGRMLKKTGLDELAQLANIVRGDMSFVGPRPKPIAEYEAGVAAGDYRRTVARAGLTGPAQLLKGTVRAPDDDLRADLAYLTVCRNGPQSRVVSEDVRVLLRTVLLMLKMTGE